MSRAAVIAALIVASFGCVRPKSAAPAPPQKKSAVPSAIAQIVSKNCVRCHDGNGDSTLDLRRLPAASDTRTWLSMMEMVEGYRMPPPAIDGPVEKRFPLPAEQREAFIDNVTHMLGKAADPRQYVTHLPLDQWLAIVTEVGNVALPAGEVDAAINKATGAITPWWALGTRGRIEPADQIYIENVSLAVCSAIAKAESARSTDERKLMVGLPNGDAASVPAEATRRLVDTLYRAVYTTPPTNDDLSSGERLLADVRGTVATWSEAWVGLCTATLSGPRVMYLYSGAP